MTEHIADLCWDYLYTNTLGEIWIHNRGGVLGRELIELRDVEALDVFLSSITDQLQEFSLTGANWAGNAVLMDVHGAQIGGDPETGCKLAVNSVTEDGITWTRILHLPEDFPLFDREARKAYDINAAMEQRRLLWSVSQHTCH
ncbi:hypothetical protein [Rhizobium laguerreae]|uniref:hypothetical protein n=1 Tax=Rhizobium laguerreae TaxID=1076926 RepID=UPI001C91491E|nr:hypothetical protein [Rhizobium laguerreae]MBY3314716.1 hypothetical protein [Rhizobium laguerreae]